MFLQKNLQALEFTNKPLQEKILSLKEDFIDIFPSQTPFVPLKDDLIKPNIFFCGIGDGLFLKKLINKHIFIFDKAEFFANVLSKMDLSQELSSGKIYLCDVEEKRLEEYLFLLFSQKDCFEYLGLFKLLPYSEFYDQSPMFDFVYQKCLDVVFRLSRTTDKNFSLNNKILKNFLFNLPSVLQNIPFQRFIYENKGKNKSVIVACAGPSLNKQLKLLKTYQDDYVIFALDATYKTLLKNEIYPDFVFSIDVQEKCRCFYENLPFNPKEPIYILSCSIDKVLVEILNFKKNIFILDYLDYQQKFNLNDFGYLDIGINVAHFAYNFAIALGFSNVIMIGQDLAFSEDGVSHADADVFSFGDIKTIEDSREKLKVLAYNKQGFIKTHIAWDEFRKRLEVLFLSNPQVSFYNATEGGAFIDYTIEKPFKEVLELLKDAKKDYILPNILSFNRQKKILLKSLELLQKDYFELNALYEDAQKILNVLKQNKTQKHLYENFMDVVLKFNTMIDESKILQSFIYKSLFYHRGLFNICLYEDPQNALLRYIDFLEIFLEFTALSLKSMENSIYEYKNILKV
ncbi:TPA: motility associated factor glycosyltransferase family protein [Campylobacter lari]|nr:motility associated factor glycosyltransferase family protein [Campylobacter lari]